jgi:transposase InsO family protein
MSEAWLVSVFEIKCVSSWAQEFLSYLTDGVLPENRVQARQIERRANAYTIINHQLYKRSVSGVFQRCVEPAEGIELLREIHQGECGHHASSRDIVGKAFRHGFYWPTALKDAEEMVKTCNGCQRFAKKRHAPASALKTIPITWPFAVWGLDMVGPFRTARGGMTHLLVMVDKFTKWIEAKPIRKLDGSTAVTFLKDIILRYGYPHSIITDNGSNFAGGVFARFCGEKGIQMDLASVAHPESNGQVEKANGLILAGIRPQLVEPLERAAGCWIEELPSVLWSLRTTPNRSVGFTPFFLVYGAEAVLPTDVEHDAPRIKLYTEEEAKEARED